MQPIKMHLSWPTAVTDWERDTDTSFHQDVRKELGIDFSNVIDTLPFADTQGEDVLTIHKNPFCCCVKLKISAENYFLLIP
ncbi:hypothetical protein CEXT_740381 [Caerostris extrusa]|uniref:Uncharacterized protein n=1 Tax=Caerostris extrusa TaxID=172846 RepID=A0AAV4MHD2_CAEEX|nr:hypothetical protein CEXT_740381 [Caerostris extrusa]